MGKKDEILDCALDLFNSSNIKNITTNHISKKMKISPGNLYYHYKNKEEIIRSLLLKFKNKHFSLCEEYRSIDDINKMSDFFDKYFKIVWDYRFLKRESYYLCNIDKEFRKMYNDHREIEIQEIFKSSKIFRNKGLSHYVDDEIIFKNAQLVSMILSNIITYDYNSSYEEWKVNCKKYKELIFYVFSRK